MRGRVTKDRTIVAEPARIPNVDGDIYLYYLVAPEAEVIGWIEPLDGTHLFRECNSARQWNHKSMSPFHVLTLTLRPYCRTGTWGAVLVSYLDQCWFWHWFKKPHRKHVEFFPHNFKLDHSRVRKLRIELDWFHTGRFYCIAILNRMTWAMNRCLNIGQFNFSYHILQQGRVGENHK